MKNKWAHVILLIFIIIIADIIFFKVDSKSHSASDTLYGVLPWYLLLGFALLLIEILIMKNKERK